MNFVGRLCEEGAGKDAEALLSLEGQRGLEGKMGHQLVAYPAYIDDVSKVLWIRLNFAP
jgi:hypothetical protein